MWTHHLGRKISALINFDGKAGRFATLQIFIAA